MNCCLYKTCVHMCVDLARDADPALTASDELMHERVSAAPDDAESASRSLVSLQLIYERVESFFYETLDAFVDEMRWLFHCLLFTRVLVPTSCSTALAAAVASIPTPSNSSSPFSSAGSSASPTPLNSTSSTLSTPVFAAAHLLSSVFERSVADTLFAPSRLLDRVRMLGCSCLTC
jgi:hypothetical protein